jgi:energy-coupling factor transporter ATP-binding protein EcfA2
MSNQSLGIRVLEELSQAVESGLLPDSVQDNAQKLLDRLRQPVRLALMGMPGSGKSTLLNLLVGSDVMTDGVQLPTLQLTYGETTQTICTLPDGSKKTLPTTNGAEIAALSPVFVEMQMPLPALAKISVLEVVAPNDVNAIHRASQWASKRSDVALWCTQSFTEDEQRIWSTMPDLIKDHAFCMVTRADALASQGLLDATLGAVSNAARDEFNQILPISTLDALAARQPDGSVNKDKMRESGGLALISAVLKQVELGRQSAVDMADVLLHQHRDILAQDTAVQTPEPVAPTLSSSPDASQPASGSATKSDSPLPDGITRLRTLAAQRLQAEEQEGLKPATRDAYKHVIQYIEDQAKELSAALQDLGESAPSEVIAQSVENIQWLCDYLNENGDDTDASLLRARDTAFDAADLVQLMQMEKRDSAALEAVSLILQIKRELQADLAA